MKNVQRTLCIILACAAAVFIAALLGIMLVKPFLTSEYNGLVLFGLTAAFIALLALIYKLCGHLRRLPDKLFAADVFLIIAIFTAVRIFLSELLRYVPAWDLDAIYSGAAQLLKQGDISGYTAYFGQFPNNIGGLLLLYTAFGTAGLFGAADYYLIAVTLNCLLAALTMACTVRIAVHLLGQRGGWFVLILFGVSLPFWFMGAVFYTHSLSMLFPVLLVNICLRFKKAGTARGRCLLALAAGVTCAVGCEIKMTVAIAALALVIVVLLKQPLKQVLPYMLVAIAAFAAVYILVSCVIYNALVSPQTALERHTPLLHWVMMGLQGDGRYNPADYAFTYSVAPDERAGAILQQIRQRIQQLGAGGMLKLWADKLWVCFGDGTYELQGFLDDSPQRHTLLNDYIIKGSQGWRYYSHYCQGLLTAEVAFAACGAIRALKRHSGTELCLNITFMGLIMFCMLWETTGRLIFNYAPVLFLCALMGIKAAGDTLRLLLNKLKKQKCAGKPGVEREQRDIL